MYPQQEDDIANQVLTYSRWESTQKEYTDPRTGETVETRVFGLIPVTTRVGELIPKFQKDVENMVTHIFKAHHQWATFHHYVSSLEVGDLLMVSDYQQNFTAEYSEAPTSMAYSGNKVTFAMFPVGVYLYTAFFRPET